MIKVIAWWDCKDGSSASAYLINVPTEEARGHENIMLGSQRHRKYETWRRKRGH